MRNLSIVGALAVLAFVGTCIAAWLTHVITMLMRVFDGVGDTLTEVLILGLGTVFAPIGAIHGVLIWFGVA